MKISNLHPLNYYSKSKKNNALWMCCISKSNHIQHSLTHKPKIYTKKTDFRILIIKLENESTTFVSAQRKSFYLFLLCDFVYAYRVIYVLINLHGSWIILWKYDKCKSVRSHAFGSPDTIIKFKEIVIQCPHSTSMPWINLRHSQNTLSY